MRRTAGLAAKVLAILVVCALGAARPAFGSVADQSTAYQLDPAHDGNSTGSNETPPLQQQWSDSFGSGISYPLVVDGTVYVTARNSLYALDEATGAVLWWHSLGGSYDWTDPAYDAGRVFAVNEDGLLDAYDAVTGALDWSYQLPEQWAFSSPPTAVNGVVYDGGAGDGGTLYANSEANGELLWTDAVATGQNSSPTVYGGQVFVTYPDWYYAFDAGDGGLNWVDAIGGYGGGGRTPVGADGDVFIRDWTTSARIVSAEDGALEGPLAATTAPAVADHTVYELAGTTLQAVPDDGLGTVQWSFSGDGELDTAPLVTGSTVWEGSATGELYAVDAATGAELSSTQLAAPIPAPDEQDLSSPLTGLGAGGGSLIVPTENSLVAFAPPGAAGETSADQVPPTINGPLQAGDQVAADVGVWSNLPLGYTYQWELCGADGSDCTSLPGATSPNYVITPAEVGSTLRVLVSATNAQGPSGSVASAASTTVAPGGAPVSEEVPQVSGAPVAGDTLLATAGTWSNSPIGFTYQWNDCTAIGSNCITIPGATNPSYTLEPADVGDTVAVSVTAQNSVGSTTVMSAPTAVVTSSTASPTPAPVDSTPPTVSGTPAVGSGLSAGAGLWSGAGPISYSYLWLACSATGCASIPGADEPTYTVTSADVGDALEVVVAASNAGGTTLATSAPTGVVPSPGGSAPSGTGTKSSTPTVKLVLRIGMSAPRTISAVVAKGRLKFTIKAPTAGKLSLESYLKEKHGKRAVLGSARLTFTRAVKRTLLLHLSRHAQRLVSREAHGATLIVTAELFPNHGQTVGASEQFKLRG